MSEKVLNETETIALLSSIAKEKGDDFQLKVFRRRSAGTLPESVALFANAQVVHVQNPETWLPRILGGGNYSLHAFHCSDVSLQVGSARNLIVSDMGTKSTAEMDLDLVKSSGWNGPRALLYPSPEDRKAASPPSATYSVSPPAPSGSVAANGGPTSSGGVPGVGSSFLQAERDHLEREKERFAQWQREATEKFARQERDAAEKQARAEREFAAEKQRLELEMVRKESEARVAASEARVTAAIEKLSQQAQAPKKDFTESIAPLLAVITPIVTQMMQSAAETRALVAKAQQDAQLENQRQRDAAAQQQQNLMTMLLAKPAIDPVIMTLLDKNKADPGAGAAMIHQMSEAMGMMTQTTMDLVHTAAEMNLGNNGGGEHPALKAIKQGVKALGSMMEGYQQAQKQQLPPMPQRQALPIAQAPVQQAAPQPPPQVVPAPAPAQAVIPATVGDTLDQLEASIKSKAEPALVAKVFVECLQREDPSLMAALDKFEGDIDELVSNRMMSWAMADASNLAYLGTLGDEVKKQANAAGLLAPEDEEDDEDEDDDAVN